MGLGSSSISSLPEGYVQNITNTPEYFESLKRNKIPIFRGYEFKNKDKMYGTIIRNLMCYLTVDLHEMNEKFNEKNEQNFLFKELLELQPKWSWKEHLKKKVYLVWK